VGTSVRTSQETHYVSATEPNRLMLFGETAAVYCENHAEHMNTLCGHFSPYFTGNTKCLRYKAQPVDVFREMNAVYCDNLTEDIRRGLCTSDTVLQRVESVIPSFLSFRVLMSLLAVLHRVRLRMRGTRQRNFVAFDAGSLQPVCVEHGTRLGSKILPRGSTGFKNKFLLR
jgi:hypothetical protein